jgi:ribosome maturation factor RimP
MATGQVERERQLQREVTPLVESALPGTEVLALEFTGKEHFCVFVDHPEGVDHALCARVTDVLRGYLDQYTVDVSSPGIDRPLRTPAHFARAVGKTVKVKTGDLRFKGEVVTAGDRAVQILKGSEPVDIPYEQIVRANLIDEGWGKG